MMNYKRMAGLSDLLQGKHPEWIHLYHSKAYTVEVPAAPVGDGAHSGHCRRHRPWHDSSFSSSSSMRNEPTAEPAAKANGDFSGEWVNVSQCWWGVFFPLSTQIPGWDIPIPSGALSHCQTHSAQAGTQVRTQPAHRAFTPATMTQKGKLPFQFLLDVLQLLIRRKWQNKHSFAS